jgi:SAM-dependent methyltransferase
MHVNLDVSGAPHGGSDADIPYKVIDWFEEFEHSRSGLHKQVAYAVLWPLFQLEARRWLSTGTLSVSPHPAVFRDRGFTNEARRRWALAGVDVRNSVILVQGTGSGWDVLMWARLRPKRIIATDLFAFDSWDDVSRHVGAKWNVPCTFHQAPLESHGFLADGSVDVCVSDSVFEHCRDLEGVLAESHRVLRPAGRLYAGYGPLWFAPGGDHYSGREGALDTVYNHLVLPPSAFRAYVERHRQSTEDFQNGYRYIALDLFSRMTTADYLRAFRNQGFTVDALVLELSTPALRFRTMFPDRHAELLAITKGRCAPDDLMLKSNLVRLTRSP